MHQFVGMVTITALQTLLSLMTISPSLNKQFNVLVDLAVVTKRHPIFALNGCSRSVIESKKMLRHKNIKQPFFVAFIGSLYSIYALLCSW